MQSNCIAPILLTTNPLTKRFPFSPRAPKPDRFPQTFHVFLFVSYHIISINQLFRITSICTIVSHRIMSYLSVSIRILPYQSTISCCIIWFIVSHRTLSYHFLSYRIMSYLLVSDRISQYHIVSSHTSPLRIVSFRIFQQYNPRISSYHSS